MGILGRTAACGLFGVLLIASGPASQAVTPSESTTTPATDVTSSHADWMKQPQAAGLLAQLTDAQADFEKAHNTQVKATKTIATLSIEINAQQAAVDAATLRIQRFAREAYIGQADADNLGALSTVMQSEGMDALAQSKALLDVVGRTQSAQIQADNAVLQHVQDLRKQQDEARTSAEATMKAAEERGQSVLKDLNDVMGISPDFEATPTTPGYVPRRSARRAVGPATTRPTARVSRNRCQEALRDVREASAIASCGCGNRLGVQPPGRALQLRWRPDRRRELRLVQLRNIRGEGLLLGCSQRGLPWAPMDARLCLSTRLHQAGRQRSQSRRHQHHVAQRRHGIQRRTSGARSAVPR